MKKLLLLAVFIAFNTMLLQAQTEANYPEPEFMMQPYYFNKSTNQLVALEKAGARIKTKAVMGFGSSGVVYAIEGKNSSVAIVAVEKPEFVITGMQSNMGMTSSQLMPLYKFNNSKKQREAALETQKQSGEFKSVEYNLKKAGDKVIFQLVGKPEPGEYAFINMMSATGGREYTAYCFRIE